VGQQDGNKAEAHQLLAPVYHWFTDLRKNLGECNFSS